MLSSSVVVRNKVILLSARSPFVSSFLPWLSRSGHNFGGSERQSCPNRITEFRTLYLPDVLKERTIVSERTHGWRKLFVTFKPATARSYLVGKYDYSRCEPQDLTSFFFFPDLVNRRNPCIGELTTAKMASYSKSSSILLPHHKICPNLPVLFRTFLFTRKVFVDKSKQSIRMF